jgi:hypothetical protein
MAKIAGVDASLITSIAGVSVTNISSIGPQQVINSGFANLGNRYQAPTGFPYTFIPGDSVTGANFFCNGSIRDNVILGRTNFNDKGNSDSTFQLRNLSSKFYNIEGDLNRYVISQWVRINDFPRHIRPFTENVFRKKRTSISRYDFINTASEGLKDGFIEFGAMAPYYKDSDNNYIHQYQFSPISLGVCIGFDGGYMVSLYTDYKFQLETWYMVTVEITSESFNDPSSTKNVKMWVDNNNQETALFLGKPWSSKANQRNKRSNNYNRNAGNKNADFNDYHLAVFPKFTTYNPTREFKTNQTWNLLFNNFVNIYEMNYASFSPIRGISGNTNSVQTIDKYGNDTKLNSRIDFGRIDIYGGDSNIEELYINTVSQYPNG